MGQVNSADQFKALNGPVLDQVPVEVAISGVTAVSSQLEAGVYYVIVDTEAFLLMGGSGVTATTSSVRLPAGVYLPVRVEDGADYIAFITTSAVGTAQIIPAR